MARGWESKSVEEQIAASQDRKAAATTRARTADDIERETRRQGLLLSRAKIVRDIENARDERHRTALRQALDYIDAQLHTL